MKKINYKTISIVGKTNVGKSTLLNNISNKKISIVTSKKNTTIRCTISKFKDSKIEIIDTPGPIIKVFDKKINDLIYESINISNTILIIIDKLKLESDDHFLLELIKKQKKEKILIINKIDKIDKIDKILGFINKIKKKYKNISEIIPLSNKEKKNLEKIKTILKLKEKEETINYINYKNIIEDTIRETLLLTLEKEIPYEIKTSILNDKINKHIKNLSIKIDTIKKTQKKIIIGKNGLKIKQIINNIKIKLKKIFINLEDVKITVN